MCIYIYIYIYTHTPEDLLRRGRAVASLQRHEGHAQGLGQPPESAVPAGSPARGGGHSYSIIAIV